MNIVSCNGCGVLLDKDKLNFPKDIYNEDSLDYDKCEWNGEQYVAFTICPVCQEKILQYE